MNSLICLVLTLAYSSIVSFFIGFSIRNNLDSLQSIIIIGNVLTSTVVWIFLLRNVFISRK